MRCALSVADRPELMSGGNSGDKRFKELTIQEHIHNMKLLLTSFLLLLATVATADDARPPNVVLILSDDQGYTDYGFMGHPEIETPNLDKLAKESALFRRGYVPTALCRPSLMTLITGLYSHQNKTTGNDPANTPANKAHAEKASKQFLAAMGKRLRFTLREPVEITNAKTVGFVILDALQLLPVKHEPKENE